MKVANNAIGIASAIKIMAYWFKVNDSWYMLDICNAP